jgi:transposase
MPQHYAGLDISLNETSICIVDQNGTRLRESAVPTDPESIAAFLQSSGLKFNRIGMEAGNLS